MLIEILPKAQGMECDICRVVDIVAVSIQFGQSFIAVFGQRTICLFGVVAEEFRTVVDDAVAGQIAY